MAQLFTAEVQNMDLLSGMERGKQMRQKKSPLYNLKMCQNTEWLAGKVCLGRCVPGCPARCDPMSVPAGSAAVGWHRSLLPGSGPALPPLLLLLAVLPPPQERGAPQC